MGAASFVFDGCGCRPPFTSLFPRFTKQSTNILRNVLGDLNHCVLPPPGTPHDSLRVSRSSLHDFTRPVFPSHSPHLSHRSGTTSESLHHLPPRPASPAFIIISTLS